MSNDLTLANQFTETACWFREAYNREHDVLRLRCATIRVDESSKSTRQEEHGNLFFHGVEAIRLPQFLAGAAFQIEAQVGDYARTDADSTETLAVSIQASSSIAINSEKSTFYIIANRVYFDPIPLKFSAPSGDITLFTSKLRGRFNDLEYRWGSINNVHASLAVLQSTHTYLRLDITPRSGDPFFMGFFNPIYIDIPVAFQILDLQHCTGRNLDILSSRLGAYLASIERYFKAPLSECADMITVFMTDNGPYFVWSQDVRF